MNNKVIKIDNTIITTPIIDILERIKLEIHNGKLQSMRVRGDNIRVTCPFHKNGKESRASSDIYIGDEVDKLQYGWFKCFTCGVSAPFYHFVASCFDSSDEFAKKWLIENFADFTSDTQFNLPKIEIKPDKKRILDSSILDKYENFHPYLISRKISKQIIDKFNLKYDPKTRNIIFPVKDENSKLIMLTRRNVYSKLFMIDEDVEKPLYLLNYMLENNINNFMITEGQIDALTAFSYGMPCVATMGAISDHQISLINKSNVRVLYIMFDNDDAGYRFRDKLLKYIRKDIITVPVDINIANKKDINDLSKEEFNKCIEDAKVKNYIKLNKEVIL